jgi:hypothetical protein
MLASPAKVVQGYTPETTPRRVLLFNPPVYDTRFPWSHWQQPVTLLQLATLLRSNECEVRLIDALYRKPEEKLKRRRKDVFKRGEVSINYWRFGQLPSELDAQLSTWIKEGWQPDEIYVEGFTTFWWRGVNEAISLVRDRFPFARIILCGAYPSLATEHAAIHSGADIIAVGALEVLTGLSLDLSLYHTHPRFTYISIGTDRRSSDELAEEFLAKANPKNEKERISQFAFADHDIVSRFPEQFRALLQTIIDQKIKVKLYALGNLRPQDLVNNPELAELLFRAGFKQLVFADDRDQPLTEESREIQLDLYFKAIELCTNAGYRWRTESLVGSACIGRPGEQLEEIAAFLTRVAHVAGSLIVVPYQPSPEECESDLPLEYQNGKLFPCAEYNGLSYRNYQDLLGLAAVFNAKNRSRTFDFLGDGLISRLVRSSIVSKSWDPRNSTGMVKERPVTVGWFNKEGKWVRS